MRIYFSNIIKKTSQKESSWIIFFYCIFNVLILKLRLQYFTQVTEQLSKKKKKLLAALVIAEYALWNKVYSISCRESQGW